MNRRYGGRVRRFLLLWDDLSEGQEPIDIASFDLSIIDPGMSEIVVVTGGIGLTLVRIEHYFGHGGQGFGGPKSIQLQKNVWFYILYLFIEAVKLYLIILDL